MTDTESFKSLRSQRRIRLGWILLVIGLLGHVVAAYLNAHGALSYQHHLAGFAILVVAAGLLCAMLQRVFWRGDSSKTFLMVGAIQAVFGVVVIVLELRAA